MGNCQTCIGGHKPSTRSITDKIKQKLKKKLKKNVQRQKTSKFSFKDYHVLKDRPKWTQVTDKYDLGEEIGRGEFGIAYLAIDKETRRRFACKSILKNNFRSYIDVEDVRREVEIMKVLPDHPNLVKLQDSFEDRNAVHLVMELCEGGELFDRILTRGHYTEIEASKIMKTIMEVVRTCHKNGFMHRDLKPENFLFADKNEDSTLKSIDFGLSIPFQPGERFTEVVGSPYYMAPELLRGDYGKEIDLWSAGVILYILLCGIPPFWDKTNKGIAYKILHGTIDFNREPWSKISNTAKHLVCRLLERDPTKRLTAEQVLEHPWFDKKPKHQNTPSGNVEKGRVKQFTSMNQLKKKALRVIADCLKAEEVKIMEKMFQMMDTDNDGKVTFDELKAGLKEIGFSLTESEMQMIVEEADVDRHGKLHYKEFVVIIVSLRRMENEEYFHRAFVFFDKNDSGFIEIYELEKAINEGSVKTDWKVLHDILKEVDKDQDGRISYSEFMAMMKTDTDWGKASRGYSTERFRSLSSQLMVE